jgi:protein-tyrosine phosphatase
LIGISTGISDSFPCCFAPRLIGRSIGEQVPDIAQPLPAASFITMQIEWTPCQIIFHRTGCVRAGGSPAGCSATCRKAIIPSRTRNGDSAMAGASGERTPAMSLEFEPTDRPASSKGRLIPLDRGFNLRDFGGYPTQSGGFVREGMLFRSGTMAYLSEADQRRMLELGIVAIIDLRRADEREIEPTRWYAGTGLDYWAAAHAASSGILRTETPPARTSSGLSADRMVELYRKLPHDHAASYRALFLKVRDGSLPILVNCAAGKDRTGVAVALLLETLGVPRDLIVQDYCLTNQHADFGRLLEFRRRSGRFANVMSDASGPMFAADRAYLAAMFDQIDQRYGNVELYARDQLQLEPDDLATIRARLVDHEQAG